MLMGFYWARRECAEARGDVQCVEVRWKEVRSGGGLVFESFVAEKF